MEACGRFWDCLTRIVARLFQTGHYSDLKLQFQDRRVLHVHKSVVCASSEVFQLACSGAFSEARTGVIEISHEDTRAVVYMVLWMYTGKPRTNGIVFNVRLYAATDFYRVRRLQNLLRCLKMKNLLQRSDNNKDVPEAIEFVFLNIPECHRDLRDTAVETCATYFDRCFANRHFREIDEPAFWAEMYLELYDNVRYYNSTRYDECTEFMMWMPQYNEYECTDPDCHKTFLVSEILQRSSRCDDCYGELIKIPLDVRSKCRRERKDRWQNRRR
ncbi:hypothetical protein HDK77DRAFT_270940 [Phyllosticta capitalensis]